MSLPLLPEEVAVIQAACKVANLRRITSGLQVEQPFRQINKVRGMLLQRRGLKIAPYQEFQTRLRVWLERITGSKRMPRDRDTVAAEVDLILRDAVHARLVLKDKGLRYDYSFRNVEGGCAMALAVLLGRGQMVTNRLQQCGWSKCLRFNFDPSPKRRPRRFCNEAHAKHFDNEGSAERQQRYRKRMRRD